MFNYFLHETVVSIYNESPNITKSPAVTICAANVFTPKRLADLYPEFNQTYRNFIERKKRHEFLNTTEILNNQLLFDKFESLAFEEYNAYEIIEKKSLQIDDIIMGCKIYPITIRNMFNSPDLLKDPLMIDPVDCNAMQNHISSIYEGYKCFTYFSDMADMKPNWRQYFPPQNDLMKLVYERCINESDEENCRWFDRLPNRTWNRNDNEYWVSDHFNFYYDFHPMIELYIKIDEDSRDFLSDNLIRIAVHSSNNVINKRSMKFFLVTEAYLCEVVFTKRVSMLMQSPYKPSCSYYGNHSNDATLKDFHTSDECRSFCMKNYTLNIDHCLNYYNALTLTNVFETMFRCEHICPHDKQNESLYLMAKSFCEDICPEECEQPLYEILDMTSFNIDTLEKQDYFARILIYISPQPFQTIKHRPAVSYEELMGAIGGHLGIWLACSCLASNEPQYCNTDFFALVQIVGEQTNPNKMTVRYRFKTLSIIRDPLRLLDNRRYKHLHTYTSSAACGVELKVGERYLIGGNLDREHDRLSLNLCRSFVEQYSNTMAVVTKEFQSLLENCNNLKPQDDEEENNDNNNGSNIDSSNRIPDTIENHESSQPESSSSSSNNNDQLEREGKPIMKFTTGLTEDDFRRRHQQQQQQLQRRHRRNRRLTHRYPRRFYYHWNL